MSTTRTRRVVLPSAADEFVNNHPAIAVFVVLEAAVVVLSVVASVFAGPSAEQQLLQEIAGLLMAVALIYGVIGVVGLGIMIGVRRLLA
ncbi:MAG: hypothetical protein ABEI98_07400 [Halorhabdus sp.]